MMLSSRIAARLCGRTARPSSARAPRPTRCYHDFAQSKFFRVSEHVRDAVVTGQPVVALESTIYTHGFPYPESIALASLLESVVRANGGIPATIGVINGVARVGMDAEELIELASTAEEKNALKVSRRDLGYICGLGLAGKRLHGGTTVSGTMMLAHMAGIKVFGTGGLGGVHRGGESSMDISADLTELGRTPVAVISSGCKSFLDIPRTLEYLETEGVCAGAFADGRRGSVDFPAFFTRDSGIRSPKVIQNEAEAAAIVYAQNKLPVTSGILFGNPVPLEHSIPKEDMDKAIDEAIHLAAVEGHQGSDNTPFVLAKIKQLSGGKSVAANRALVESNVERATKVAVELAKLERLDKINSDRHMPAVSGKISTDEATLESKLDLGPIVKSVPEKAEKPAVLVAGSLAIDLSCDYAPLDGKGITPVPQTSNPAIIKQSLGGVGHNVAIAVSRDDVSVLFCSIVGDDLSGRAALTALEKEKLTTEGIRVLPALSGMRTAQYVAINDTQKDLVVAMADMGIMEFPRQDLDFEAFWEPMVTRAKPHWVVLDANWSPEILSKWIEAAKKHGARVAFEPVSTAKCRRLFAAVRISDSVVPSNAVSLATPNQLELTMLHTAARESGLLDSDNWWHVIDAMGIPSSASTRERLASLTSTALVDQGIPQQTIQLLPLVPCILTTLGADGVLLTQLLRPADPRLTSPEAAPYILSRGSTSLDSVVGGVYMRHFPPAAVLHQGDISSVNGAGDTFLGALVAGLARGGQVENIVPVAQGASLKVLRGVNG